MNVMHVTAPQPNTDLIKALERLLDQARTGELRAMTYTAEWRGRRSSHGWWLETETDYIRTLGEVTQLQAEFTINIQLQRDDSLIHGAKND